MRQTCRVQFRQSVVTAYIDVSVAGLQQWLVRNFIQRKAVATRKIYDDSIRFDLWQSVDGRYPYILAGTIFQDGTNGIVY